MNEQTIPHDYYYGCEAEQYTFYRFPKALFTNNRYKAMSDSAKILYGLMLDRMGLSTGLSTRKSRLPESGTPDFRLWEVKTSPFRKYRLPESKR